MGVLLSREEIKNILPHREPFLFLDRVLEMESGKRILAACRFRTDEYFFRGHFPGDPVAPGVILVEAMAQAAGVLAYCTTGQTYKDKGAALLRIEKMSFRRPVRPEEEVIIEATVSQIRGPAWRYAMTATVDSEICADGEILAIFTEKANK